MATESRIHASVDTRDTGERDPQNIRVITGFALLVLKPRMQGSRVPPRRAGLQSTLPVTESVYHHIPPASPPIACRTRRDRKKENCVGQSAIFGKAHGLSPVVRQNWPCANGCSCPGSFHETKEKYCPWWAGENFGCCGM